MKLSKKNIFKIIAGCGIILLLLISMSYTLEFVNLTPGEKPRVLYDNLLPFPFENGCNGHIILGNYAGGFDYGLWITSQPRDIREIRDLAQSKGFYTEFETRGFKAEALEDFNKRYNLSLKVGETLDVGKYTVSGIKPQPVQKFYDGVTSASGEYAVYNYYYLVVEKRVGVNQLYHIEIQNLVESSDVSESPIIFSIQQEGTCKIDEIQVRENVKKLLDELELSQQWIDNMSVKKSYPINVAL
ncbi:Uncharacterised protein [uncultured archaeon]|nr:Uncharacterised protein [uncultured archaeon]